MSDGVKIATTYYVPDGVPPTGGWPAVMLFHGLGGSRTDPGTPLGMSLNSFAETQLAPQGYAALTFDARGHGQSEGLVSIDGPREIQDVRELFGWLAAHAERQRRADRCVRLLVRRRRHLARDGGRRPVRRDRAGDHVDRPLLGAPAAGSRTLGRAARLLAVDPGACGARPRVDRERRDRGPESRRGPRVRRRAIRSHASGLDPRADVPHAGPARLRLRPRPCADGLFAPEGARNGSTSPTSGTRPPRTRRGKRRTCCPRRAIGSTAT